MSGKQSPYLALIVALYALLAISYALATPPLEASDEYKHYPVVQFVQNQRAFPILDPDDPGLWLQEGAQQPLYYGLMAIITSWIDTSDLQEVHQVNPHAFVGDPNQLHNKNLIIHNPEQEKFPWQGTVLAVYVIRFFSIALGMGTIVITARLGSTMFSPVVGLLSAALTAFNPMFLFVNAAVNNDALAILLGNLGLYMLVRIWRDVPDPRKDVLRYAALGVVLGLGVLTKLSLAGLIVLSGLALLVLSWKRHDWRILFLGGIVTLLVALAITAPWFFRNLREYGDPTALNVFVAVQGTRDSPITWQDWKGEFGTFYRSFWGLFGGVNIAPPEIFYHAYNLIALTGAAGLLFWLWRQWRRRHGNGRLRVGNETDGSEDLESGGIAPDTADSKQAAFLSPIATEAEQAANPQRGIWLLIAWSVFLFLLLLRWSIIYPAFQGRLLFPALGALNVLWAIGLLSWIPASRRNAVASIIATFAFVVAAVLPWTVIRPAYVLPEPLSSVPDEAKFGPFTFRTESGALQLIGVEMPDDQSVTPGSDPLELTLYWKAEEPVNRDYLSSVHLLGRDLVSVGQVDRYPAWGMIPTSQWQTSQIWRDEYRVRVNDTAETPSRLLVKAGIYDTTQGTELPVLGPDGEEIEILIVGDARLAADSYMDLNPPASLERDMEDGISFLGYGLLPEESHPGEELVIELYWEVKARPSRDYTVFIHLVDPDGNLIKTADGPPVSGDYPSSYWRTGDVVVDKHILNLPADLTQGVYSLLVGLYDPNTLDRLGLADGSSSSISLPVEVQQQ